MIFEDAYKDVDGILKDLKEKKYFPVYLLCGEEPYYIDLVSDFIEANVLTDDEKAFNQSVMYGSDISVANVIDACKRYPMMAEKQVVIVKEAQSMRSFENLIEYVEKPSPSTILVLNYKNKTLDKRTSLYKKISKDGCAVISNRIKEHQVATWVNAYVKNQGYSIDSKGTSMLADYFGNDLDKLVNGLEKLFFNIPAKAEITPEIISKYLSISKDYNIFELNKALAVRDVLKANTIIAYFTENPKDHSIHALIPILYGLFFKTLLYKTYYGKVSSGELTKIMEGSWFPDQQTAAKTYTIDKLERIIGYLRDYNARSLGVDNNSGEGELMRELVFKILH